MTIDGLYTKLNYLSGKDKRGKTFKITEFNTLLPTIQDSLFSKELDDLVKGDVMKIPESRLSITPLRPFKATDGKTVDDGSYQLPTDYVRWISVSAGYREVEIKTENDFNKIRTSVFRRPVVMPIGYFTATDIMIVPTNIGSTELQYFRKPLVPYYDYCQDTATMNEVFMPVGSVIHLDDAQVPCLYDSAGVLMKQTVEKAGVAYPYTSKTVELEWEAIYHDNFVLAMLALVGINIDKNELTLYSEAKLKDDA